MGRVSAAVQSWPFSSFYHILTFLEWSEVKKDLLNNLKLTLESFWFIKLLNSPAAADVLIY